jgi:hypothetical protein
MTPLAVISPSARGGGGGRAGGWGVWLVGIMRAIPWKAALGNWVINWGIDMQPRVAERDDALRAAPRRCR